MRRRDLFAVAASMAALRPLIARAQQPERMRRIGILHDYDPADPEGQAQIGAFREALQKLGWVAGDNLQIQYRSGAVEGDQLRTAAAEILALKPDAVLAAGGTIVAALQRVT